MQLDLSIFETMKTVPWFSRCGTPSENIGFDVEWLSEWSQAQESLESPEWKMIETDALGNLTAFLATKHASKYQGIWNRLVREATPKIEALFIPAAVAYQQERQLRKTFLNYVRWDCLGIIMESTYKPCRPPVFYTKFLSIYQSGHFPCGWKGQWPEGRPILI